MVVPCIIHDGGAAVVDASALVQIPLFGVIEQVQKLERHIVDVEVAGISELEAKDAAGDIANPAPAGQRLGDKAHQLDEKAALEGRVLRVVGEKGEVAVISRQQTRKDGWVAGGTVAENGIQRLLVNKHVIQKRVLLHQVPAKRIDEDAKTHRLLFHPDVPLIYAENEAKASSREL